MKLSTDVDITSLAQKMRYKDKILLMGSCFADNIGTKLAKHYYSVLVNPFGVLFNPESICALLSRAIGNGVEPEWFTRDDLFLNNGLYYSWLLHGEFANSSAETVLLNANKSLAECRDFLNNSKWIIITLGTSWIYRLKENNLVVSNCHKMPTELFDRERMCTKDIGNSLGGIFEKMFAINKELSIILTVSPVRHQKDGLHQNQLSKAALLLAADELCRSFANVHYFPAYEIMMDQLRDYRFYDTDMCHPNQLAVDIIFEKFREYALSSDKEEQSMFERAEKIHALMEHRILNAGSTAAAAFEQKREQEFNDFMYALSIMKSSAN